MKKFLCCCSILCALLVFTSCYAIDNISDTQGIANHAQSLITDSAIYSVSRNEDLTYAYRITDKKGNVLFSDEASMKEPDIRQVSENVYSVTIQAGTGQATNWAVFCDVEKGCVSDVFHHVLGAQGEYVFCGDCSDGIHSVVVQNIFDDPSCRKAYTLTDAGPFADPILGLAFTGEGCAAVTYLTGDEANETSITIDFP